MERRVRETEEIRFALDVFTAINSDNYTRFFRLARRATLLQGCILLRYFYQVGRKRTGREKSSQFHDTLYLFLNNSQSEGEAPVITDLTALMNTVKYASLWLV